MTKELFVSSTPHETRVGVVEDDDLAEIYLEREKEYTLAGSVYKGRVTRVLPGMQSAFVDIGLERDAFLYVSDFMELPEGEDEVEEISTKNSRPQPSQPHETQPSAEAREAAPSIAPEAEVPPVPPPSGENRPRTDAGRAREGGGDWRSRRRRRGRRGVRVGESRLAKPESPSPQGYQPMVLPGESISKYQRLSQAAPGLEPVSGPVGTSAPPASAAIARESPEDEPLFGENREMPTLAMDAADEQCAGAGHDQARARETAEQEPSSRDPKPQHLEQNVASVFDKPEGEEDGNEPGVTESSAPRAGLASAIGTLEEEVIEEDEADLMAYVQDFKEDAAFDEIEEETQRAEDYQPQELDAPLEPTTQSEAAFAPEPVSPQSTEALEAKEEAEEEAEEDELEQAQAEAEALIAAEAQGEGSVEARAEVRAPSETAGYSQRTQRQTWERRGGPRGRRGGRRFRRQDGQQLPQITDLLKEGQEILVQIAKEPIAKKGARITSHIALPGRFLVYLPTVHHTGVSRKISSDEERQRLRRIILSERENGHGGFIVRTAAQGASEEELRADIRFLKGLWSEIKARADASKAPTLIYHDLNVVERVLRDQVTSDFSAIWVDNEQEYERILRFANRFQPALVRRVKLYSKENPLFDEFGLNEEINKALKSKVWLKSGGYIVINQTEALVAIDVNTGKYVGKTARLEDTIVKTNVDAIREIVRQIRLRDLGGIIIIDFIDMDERRNRQKVMQALEEALRGDRSPSKVLQFNDFGLVAITRKRVKQSLERAIGTPCPYCQSTGFVKSVTTVCNDIYLEVRKMAKHLEHSDVMLRVNPEVAKALKSSNARLLNEMEELTGRTVIVKSDPSLHQEQFDIH
ncbi:MAG TPA: Rne/Rng family ribonuclease [Terriglobales bacterium]|nr:Rne/Rng family ribonuclease [Terriglobales bacterium]